MAQLLKGENYSLNTPALALKPATLVQTATTGALCFGTALGYSSPAGILLTSNSTDSSLQLTTVENSWFSSSVNLGALVGGPIGGLCVNAIGRRGTMLALFPFFFGSWTIIGEGGLVCLFVGCGRWYLFLYSYYVFYFFLPIIFYYLFFFGSLVIIGKMIIIIK